MPVLVMLPFVADHVTPSRFVPVMVALKFLLAADSNVMLAGLIDTPTGGFTVTVAVADFVGSATLVAVNVTVVAALTVGAVYRPLDDTLPLLVDHVTD